MNGVSERREGESMKRIIETITCDRCGKEISDCPVRIVSHHVTKDSGSQLSEGSNELLSWIERMMNKDFCEECTADIVAFALNGNSCDECVDEILHSVNERTEEENGPDDPEGTADTADVDRNAALDRMGQVKQPDGNAAGPQETVPEHSEGGERSEGDQAKEMGTTKGTIAVTISKCRNSVGEGNT